MNLTEAYEKGITKREWDSLGQPTYEWEDERGTVKAVLRSYYSPGKKCNCCGHVTGDRFGYEVVERWKDNGQTLRLRYEWSDSVF